MNSLLNLFSFHFTKSSIKKHKFFIYLGINLLIDNIYITNDAIIEGCDAAQIGAIQYAIDVAKEMKQAVERIWIDGGNAKILAGEISQISKLNKLKIEVSEGLVLRGLWAWLLKNL